MNFIENNKENKSPIKDVRFKNKDGLFYKGFRNCATGKILITESCGILEIIKNEPTLQSRLVPTYERLVM